VADGLAVEAAAINECVLVSGPVGTLGSHILADFYGISAQLLRSGADLEVLLRRAAQIAGAKVLASHFHSFGSAEGVTGVVLLAESHISIHTWPENDFAAVDIFMCGSANPQRALDALVEALAPTRQHVEVAARGGGVP
jgi:S-adenosylmethionine decarboxylase